MRVHSELPTTAAAVREAIHRRIDQLVAEDPSLLELGEARKRDIEAPLKSYVHERAFYAPCLVIEETHGTATGDEALRCAATVSLLLRYSSGAIVTRKPSSASVKSI